MAPAEWPPSQASLSYFARLGRHSWIRRLSLLRSFFGFDGIRLLKMKSSKLESTLASLVAGTHSSFLNFGSGVSTTDAERIVRVLEVAQSRTKADVFQDHNITNTIKDIRINSRCIPLQSLIELKELDLSCCGDLD